MRLAKRMWRAFWAAMREPVRRYAPDATYTIRVDVECEDALRQIDALAERAQQLRAEAKWLR